MSIKNNPLLEEYRHELNKVWRNDQKMVEYCINTAQSLVKLSGGQLFVTSKPRIETQFPFGYSSCGQGPTFEECSNTMNDFLKHAEEWFMHKNLDGFDSYIKQLYTDSARQPYLVNQYLDDRGANIALVSWISEFDFDSGHVSRTNCIPLSDEDKQTIKEVYLADKAAMNKRCEAYLKKYGTNKLRIWRYWIDD